MLSDETWRRITACKQPRNRTVAIGDLAGRVASSYSEVIDGQLTGLRQALDAVVDDDFRGHCQVMGLRRGRLVIGVDDPARVDLMRRRYLFPLLEHLSSATPARVTDIQWVVHRD